MNFDICWCQNLCCISKYSIHFVMSQFRLLSNNFICPHDFSHFNFLFLWLVFMFFYSNNSEEQIYTFSIIENRTLFFGISATHTFLKNIIRVLWCEFYPLFLYSYYQRTYVVHGLVTKNNNQNHIRSHKIRLNPKWRENFFRIEITKSSKKDFLKIRENQEKCSKQWATVLHLSLRIW